MKKEVKEYLENLFEKFDENWDLRKEIAAFGKYLHNPDWIILHKIPTTLKALKGSGFNFDDLQENNGIVKQKTVPMEYKKWEKGLLRADKEVGFDTPSFFATSS